MPGREYVCGQCRHHFRTPDGAPLDTRSLMCPACGSLDLTISVGERPAPSIVMRARVPAGVGRRTAERINRAS